MSDRPTEPADREEAAQSEAPAAEPSGDPPGTAEDLAPGSEAVSGDRPGAPEAAASEAAPAATEAAPADGGVTPGGGDAAVEGAEAAATAQAEIAAADASGTADASADADPAAVADPASTGPAASAAPEPAEPSTATEPADAPVDAASARSADAAAPQAAPAVTEPDAPSEAQGAETPPDRSAGNGLAPAPPRRPDGGPGRTGGRTPGQRPPRQREPLPWPELRAAATVAAEGQDVNELKELFRLLPNEVRDETVDGVREYRKGARRPVSAFAGKSLARAVHTARRARRRPDSDEQVSEALGQALAAEIIASLDVEIAAEVILPKRDLLERQSRQARRQARDDEMRDRDERRRRARDEASQSGSKTFGTYSGAKIRGLDQLQKLLEKNDEK